MAVDDQPMTVTIIHGDARTALRDLPENSVHCVVTSPPYLGLRDYGVAGQIGLEETPEAYVDELVAVFREVRRVLRPDGTCWLNLGDSYAGGRGGPKGQTGQMSDRSIVAQRIRHRGADRRGAVLKDKDLIGVPWMIAFALRADGWWLRRDIIWAKGNPMPESVTDRPTSAHEYVFLLTKCANYFYDGWGVRENVTGNSHRRKSVNPKALLGGFKVKQNASFAAAVSNLVANRNCRSVWEVNSEASGVAHFATMPTKIAEKYVLAGTSDLGACPSCGAPMERLTGKDNPDLGRGGGDASDLFYVERCMPDGVVEKFTVGWQMTCDCPIGRPVPCTVLDPFGGAGTTALVADRLARNATIVEIKAEYVEMAAKRIVGDGRMFASVVVEKEREVCLLEVAT